MGLNKVMKQLCVTAALVVLSTVTAFAANVGQASGTNGKCPRRGKYRCKCVR